MNSRDIKKVFSLRNPAQILILIALVGITLWIDHQKDASDPVAKRGVTTGTCVNVIDGDTIDVLTDDGETLRIRLLGVDCMETHNELKMTEQAERLGRTVEQIRMLGERAKDEMRDFALNAPVKWEIPQDTPLHDPYDRVLAYVSVEEQDLGEFLLINGLAEVRRDRHPRKPRYRRVAKPLLR